MITLSALIVALGAAVSSLAHQEGPATPEQIRVYSELQQAAYHCAPAVAAYTADRRRMFEQQVLGGSGTLSAGDLFAEGSYSDVRGDMS